MHQLNFLPFLWLVMFYHFLPGEMKVSCKGENEWGGRWRRKEQKEKKIKPHPADYSQNSDITEMGKTLYNSISYLKSILIKANALMEIEVNGKEWHRSMWLSEICVTDHWPFFISFYRYCRCRDERCLSSAFPLLPPGSQRELQYG